jgi:cyclopropane-fatty-acyl-phospholipid synthase
VTRSVALSHPGSDALRHSAALFERLFPPPRHFAIRFWEGTELPAAAGPSFSLVLNHAGALRRMFRPPIELSLGEAFIYNDFDITGDISAAARLMDSFADWVLGPRELWALTRDVLALPAGGPAQPRNMRGPARLSGARHSRERDRAAVQYHYDVGNDFYALWLDRHMQYSCAYFPTGTEDLDTAQEHKLEHICRKLRLKPGERLLDIGCGWGGLAEYAAQHFGVQVLGVTLSDKQAGYANERLARAGLSQQAAVKIQDYRDLGAESFDKIVSVGMFEHVGRAHLPEYFAQAYRLLKPGGLFLNHGISQRAEARTAAGAWSSVWQRWVDERVLGTGSFSGRYIFPDGELIPVSEVNLMAEGAGFEVRDVENLRQHYALTLRQWVNRLAARQTEAVSLAGEVTYRTWRLYMAASAHGFDAGLINVNQTLLARLAGGRANVPFSRADVYV